jgi:hypothetical protein
MRGKMAKRNGFYSQALDEAEKVEMEEAKSIEGIDDEIALLRVMLKRLVDLHPEALKLQLEAANTLARLVRTRYNITKEQRNSLKEAIANVLREIAIPLGIRYLP